MRLTDTVVPGANPASTSCRSASEVNGLVVEILGDDVSGGEARLGGRSARRDRLDDHPAGLPRASMPSEAVIPSAARPLLVT